MEEEEALRAEAARLETEELEAKLKAEQDKVAALEAELEALRKSSQERYAAEKELRLEAEAEAA